MTTKPSDVRLPGHKFAYGVGERVELLSTGIKGEIVSQYLGKTESKNHPVECYTIEVDDNPRNIGNIKRGDKMHYLGTQLVRVPKPKNMHVMKKA